MHTQKPLKHKVIDEIKQFLIYTVCLTLLFGTFNFYQRVLLNEYTGAVIPYGISVIEALILAKVIMLGDMIKLGSWFSRSPLIYTVLHKTIVFCIAVYYCFRWLNIALLGFIPEKVLRRFIMSMSCNICIE
jgi:hypothetical protein